MIFKVHSKVHVDLDIKDLPEHIGYNISLEKYQEIKKYLEYHLAGYIDGEIENYFTNQYK